MLKYSDTVLIVLKMRLSILSASLLTLGLSISPIYVSANPLTGTISQIIDGDTINISNNGSTTKLQLACIDAPDWINGKPQYKAQSSKNRLTQLLPIGSSIQYYSLNKIRGNRVLAVIFKGDNNINLQMIAEGQAKLHPDYTSKCPGSSKDLFNAQTNAQNRRLGIWNR